MPEIQQIRHEITKSTQRYCERREKATDRPLCAAQSAWSSLEWVSPLFIPAGASNLLDEYPDESANANNFFGNFAFDPINPIGLNGRFVYLRTEARF